MVVEGEREAREGWQWQRRSWWCKHARSTANAKVAECKRDRGRQSTSIAQCWRSRAAVARSLLALSLLRCCCCCCAPLCLRASLSRCLYRLAVCVRVRVSLVLARWWCLSATCRGCGWCLAVLVLPPFVVPRSTSSPAPIASFRRRRRSPPPHTPRSPALSLRLLERHRHRYHLSRSLEIPGRSWCTYSLGVCLGYRASFALVALSRALACPSLACTRTLPAVLGAVADRHAPCHHRGSRQRHCAFLYVAWCASVLSAEAVSSRVMDDSHHHRCYITRAHIISLAQPAPWALTHSLTRLIHSMLVCSAYSKVLRL